MPPPQQNNTKIIFIEFNSSDAMERHINHPILLSLCTYASAPLGRCLGIGGCYLPPMLRAGGDGGAFPWVRWSKRAGFVLTATLPERSGEPRKGQTGDG